MLEGSGGQEFTRSMAKKAMCASSHESIHLHSHQDQDTPAYIDLYEERYSRSTTILHHSILRRNSRGCSLWKLQTPVATYHRSATYNMTASRNYKDMIMVSSGRQGNDDWCESVMCTISPSNACQQHQEHIGYYLALRCMYSGNFLGRWSTCVNVYCTTWLILMLRPQDDVAIMIRRTHISEERHISPVLYLMSVICMIV